MNGIVLRVALVWVVGVWAAAAGAAESAASAPASKPTSKPVVMGQDGSPVVAYIGTQEITQAELDKMLRRPTNNPAIPADVLHQHRQRMLPQLLTMKLYESYAKDHPEEVPEAEIEALLKKYEERFKPMGRTLEEALKDYGMTLEEFRKRLPAEVVYNKVTERGKDEKAIAEYYENNKADFDGSRVTAKHILIRVDPYFGTPEDWEKARTKLLELREDIRRNKITFDAAVREYSEDPGKARSATLDPFQRHGMMVEPFAAAAFRLKPGEISEPVKTNYGYHIIQLVSRDPGEPQTLDQARQTIQNVLTGEAHEKFLEQQRAKHPVRVLMEYKKPPPPPPPPTRPATRPTTRPTTRPFGRPTATRMTPPPAPGRQGPQPREPEGPPPGTPTAPPAP